MKVNFADFVPISTIDYTGKSACVVFFKGCLFNCGYCHNHDHIDTINIVDEQVIRDKISSSAPFVTGVVFSGGETTAQPQALMSLATFVKELGLDVAIQTNGYYPHVVHELVKKNLIDKVFMDLKACPTNIPLYKKVVGRNIDVNRILHTIEILDSKSVPTELRTTVFKNLNGVPEDIDDVVFWLHRNIRHKENFEYVLQRGMLKNAPEGCGLIEVDEEYLLNLANGHVKPIFKNVSVRTEKGRVEV